MEIWKDIKGYEGIYMISSLGRVKSLEKKSKNHSGFFKTLKEKTLKTHISKTGYYVVDLKLNCYRKTFKIHRLLAIHFLEKPDGKDFVNHKNGIKIDNNLSNLEWCTIKENNLHAVKTGLRNDLGVNNKNSKLSVEDVFYIRNSNLKVSDLAIKFDMNQSTIYKLKRGVTYKTI
jgi:hypothetical protein